MSVLAICGLPVSLDHDLPGRPTPVAFHAPFFELSFHIIKHGWIPAEENRAVSGRQRRLCKFLERSLFEQGWDTTLKTCRRFVSRGCRDVGESPGILLAVAAKFVLVREVLFMPDTVDDTDALVPLPGFLSSEHCDVRRQAGTCGNEPEIFCIGSPFQCESSCGPFADIKRVTLVQCPQQRRKFSILNQNDIKIEFGSCLLYTSDAADE